MFRVPWLLNSFVKWNKNMTKDGVQITVTCYAEQTNRRDKICFFPVKKIDVKNRRTGKTVFPVTSRYVTITKCKIVASFIEFRTETNSFRFHGEYSKHRLMKCYAMFRNGSFNLSSRVSFRTSWEKTYVTDVCNDISD